MIKRDHGGFIAITTTMILSVILLVVATSLSFSGFFTRYNILDSELKKVSTALAEGCVDQALLELATNSSPGYPETISINGQQCKIESISDQGSNKIIVASSDYKYYITRLIVSADKESLQINCWNEGMGSSCP